MDAHIDGDFKELFQIQPENSWCLRLEIVYTNFEKSWSINRYETSITACLCSSESLYQVAQQRIPPRRYTRFAVHRINPQSSKSKFHSQISPMTVKHILHSRKPTFQVHLAHKSGRTYAMLSHASRTHPFHRRNEFNPSGPRGVCCVRVTSMTKVHSFVFRGMFESPWTG